MQKIFSKNVRDDISVQTRLEYSRIFDRQKVIDSHIEIKRRFCNHYLNFMNTVKILKIGTPEIITIIILQLEQLDFTVQYCVQKMQTE